MKHELKYHFEHESNWTLLNNYHKTYSLSIRYEEMMVRLKLETAQVDCVLCFHYFAHHKLRIKLGIEIALTILLSTFLCPFRKSCEAAAGTQHPNRQYMYMQKLKLYFHDLWQTKRDALQNSRAVNCECEYIERVERVCVCMCVFGNKQYISMKSDVRICMVR